MIPKYCPQPELVTTFKFSANGTNYEWTGSLASNVSKGSIITNEPSLPHLYHFEAISGGALNTVPLYSMRLMLLDTTAVRTYTTIKSIYDPHFWGSEIHLNAVHYTSYAPGDFVIITITKIENNYAQGTISVKLSQFPTDQKWILQEFLKMFQ